MSREPTPGEWYDYRQHQQRNFARGILNGLALTVIGFLALAVFIWLVSGIDLGAI